MERKLASVQRVIAILPIAGADAIEAVQINGWQCVTKKGEFAIGDLGVYLEIDAIPPDLPPYQFLWTPKKEPLGSVPRPPKARIKTMRLRGCLSQGLFMPLGVAGLATDVVEGADVTEVLGVGKYEPPLPSGMGDARAAFPRLVPKTDEIRVQSLPEVLNELAGQPYIITQKYDGTSATFLIDPDDGTFHACGRNWSILPGDNCYWAVATLHELEARLRALEGRYALQGEVCGPGIQKNPLALAKISLFLFNVYDLVAHRHVDDAELRRIANEIGVPAVAIIEQGESFAHDQASLLALAEGKYPGTSNEREGIVIRPREDRYSPALNGRLSFKAISNRYLLDERD
jgi:RNA ligase (TIGR02306 family)